MLALVSRIDVAVTAPVESVLPWAEAHRPTLSEADVVVTVLVMTVLEVSVTWVGVADADADAELPLSGLVTATVMVSPLTAVTLPETPREP